jgi:hypothetical protein
LTKDHDRVSVRPYADRLLLVAESVFRYLGLCILLLIALLLMFQFILQFDHLRIRFSTTEQLEGVPYSVAPFCIRRAGVV